jgi:outer membrane protein TolC
VQAADLARAALADAIGTAGTQPQLVPGALVTLPDVMTGPLDVKSHPAAKAGEANIEAVRARERGLDRAYYPTITFESAYAGRGTGADVPGVQSLGSGLRPQVPNWAIGASVRFGAFDFFSINARRRVEAQNEVAESARYEQTIQKLTTQEAKAQALLKAATEIARNTPIERDAATAGESQARARYQSGLASVTEVAEAQRLLAQAEADDAVARLGVWRALLAAAQARGDLTPFLDKIK